MKGVVFTEFVELVEGTFSPHLMDELFEAVSLKSGGAYTSVGTYDYLEMVALATELSQRTGVAVPELLRAFGKQLLRQFVIKFPAFFETANAFEFLERVDGYIHVEVKKLYPDAELPRFAVSRSGDDRLEMVYISDRPFEDLAFGLIEGAIEHFGDSVEIDRDTTDAGIRFVLTARCEEPACLYNAPIAAPSVSVLPGSRPSNCLSRRVANSTRRICSCGRRATNWKNASRRERANSGWR